MLKIGILDFGVIPENSNAISTIHETIELARLSEEHGFSRYWLSEHYEGGMAWKSQELILTLLAGYTEQIRIGSAGVLLALHSPIKVAQHYKLLENLYPGRIDLGFAKGSADFQLAQELLDGADLLKNHENFFDRVIKVKKLIEDKYGDIELIPTGGLFPQYWVMGASAASIDFVVAQRFHFSLSLFHTDVLPSPDIIKKLKSDFFDKHQSFPKFNIALSAYCSENELLNKNVKNNIQNLKVNFSGNAQALVEYVDEIKNKFETDEIVIACLGKSLEEKRNILEVLSKKVIFRLSPETKPQHL